jgi:arabinan endo-1,5-alpha-L-arabinosidase
MKTTYTFLVCLLLMWQGNVQAQQTSKHIVVHDPVMIRQGDTYYLFNTGKGIAMWSSKDMQHWKQGKPVFPTAPEWALKAVPGFKGNHIWAPDISYHNGKYYLYYSISAFGKNTSCIGLATNTTLNPNDKKYKWEDHGKVIQSVPGRDMWNAIDPNLITDKDGTPWLAFGSFWNGLKLVKLREDRMGVAQPEEWTTIASRKRDFALADTLAGDGAIEAPFIFKRDGYYYLFASTDYCCRGENSDYKMVVGRAKEVKGPYLDKEGKPMSQGGGSLVLQGDKAWNGVGHNAVASFEGKDYLIFHAYDAADKGKPKLRIEQLSWSEDHWPQVVVNQFGNP